MNTPPRRWLAGFLLLGVLLGVLGSLVISWQYHIDVEPQLIGLHFLALNAGYVIAVATSQRLLLRLAPRTLALVSCCIAAAALSGLSFVPPPVWVGWRMALLAVLGTAGGMLATSLLYAFGPYFSKTPASALNRAGLFMGCGCLLATLTNAISYFAGLIPSGTALLAAIPLAFFLLILFDKSAVGSRSLLAPREEARRETLRDLRSIAKVLLSLLLFFQFGNEWAIAGWLPLFVVHRLGGSPVSALLTLAAYFLALMLGRLAMQKLLSKVQHWKFLLGSVTTSIFGCLLLSLSGSLATAWLGVIVIGASFAPIYPLVAERLDDRFSYHPGLYNGTVSIAITGAMSAPWLLGFVDANFGMRYVMLLPAVGSVFVLILSLLIMLEAHLMGSKAAPLEQVAGANRF